MLKVQILAVCPYCKGEAMEFVAEEIDCKGEPYNRYRPCYMCHGSGEYPKWVSMDEFSRLLEQEHCPHEHTTTLGRMHFSAGEVWDDIEEICIDCGANLDAR